MIRPGIQLEMKDNDLIHGALLTTLMAGSVAHVGSFQANSAIRPKEQI